MVLSVLREIGLNQFLNFIFIYQFNHLLLNFINLRSTLQESISNVIITFFIDHGINFRQYGDNVSENLILPPLPYHRAGGIFFVRCAKALSKCRPAGTMTGKKLIIHL